MTHGSLHPITHILRVVVSAFGDMGFDIVDAPEIDTALYNFDVLRIGEDHPARQAQDTFWLKDGRLLRTHTTNMQLHITEKRKPPIRVMHFGPVYRNEATDATHDVIFTNFDCLVVEEGASLANLLSVLDTFLHRVFGPGVKYRFRPHFFPYTEPSVEVDIWYKDRWVELLGSGMVHPEVLTNLGISPDAYSGFAFGIGLERIAIIKWGVDDIRQFHANKVSFLRQFKEES